jgi:hypothetical protein
MIKTIKHGINLIKHAARDISTSSKRSPQWRHVQQDFLSKNPCCAVCKSTTRLNVHHKKPFHLHPELELDENNLITLCMSKKECHLLIGHGNDFKAYNPNIEKDTEILEKDISKFSEIEKTAKLNRKYE